MTEAGDACGSVDVEPDVIVAAQPGDPGVEPHAHPDPGGRRPLGAGQRALGIGGCGHRCRRLREHHQERVTLRAAFRRAVPAERLAKDRVVALEDLGEDRRAEVLDEPGRPLHVREQEGHRSGGKHPLRHGRSAYGAERPIPRSRLPSRG